MRIVIGRKTAPKIVARLKKRARIRKRVSGTSARPRMTVFRSANHIYAQIIDDTVGKTIVEASSRTVSLSGRPVEVAKGIGQELAKRAQKKQITAVVFDRSGYL
jgi:large subunit ribosomal protein L18